MQRKRLTSALPIAPAFKVTLTAALDRGQFALAIFARLTSADLAFADFVAKHRIVGGAGASEFPAFNQ